MLRLMRFSLGSVALLRPRTMEVEYMPGDVALVTSSLYRVVHDPPEAGEHLKTFQAGALFPFCAECGRKVRYVLPSRVLRKKI